jgi:hypothetical protein
MRPGFWKVDIYPIVKYGEPVTVVSYLNEACCRYVPSYLKELQDGCVKELGLFKRKLLEVKERMVRQLDWLTTTQPTCFGKYLLERQRELDLSDGKMAHLARSMFGARSDTTAFAISVSVMAAACYPEAQRRVQVELDQVIGQDRGQIHFGWP